MECCPSSPVPDAIHHGFTLSDLYLKTAILRPAAHKQSAHGLKSYER